MITVRRAWEARGVDAREVVLDFAPTERNGPTREFLAELFGDGPWPAELRLARPQPRIYATLEPRPTSWTSSNHGTSQ